jgi:hypothetical protein
LPQPSYLKDFLALKRCGCLRLPWWIGSLVDFPVWRQTWGNLQICSWWCSPAGNMG